MIPFDFDYYRPSTAKQAVELYVDLKRSGKNTIYYSGGTELLTLGRLNKVSAEAVIDMKGIDECTQLELDAKELKMGAALSLSKLQQSRLFPLLSETVKEIADQTSRNKITLGGNICGSIYYREAVLPLLIADTDILIEGKQGRRRVPLLSIFDQYPRLNDGDLLLQLITKADFLDLPYYSFKKRRQWDIGYPLITVAALIKDGRIRASFSGLCPFPFRNNEIEDILNNTNLSPEAKIEQAIQVLPKPICADVEGSPEYRLFCFKNMLLDVMQIFEGDAHARY